MIVGSRLQAIAIGAIAAAAVIGLVNTQPLILVPAIVAGLFAASRLLLRVELHLDSVHVRRWRGTTTSARSATAAAMGHRYLELDLPESGSVRIEVPVEIRPNVRAWVDGGELRNPEESGDPRA